MENKYTWDLTDIFKTKEDLEKEILEEYSYLEKIRNFQGKLKDSSENIYECYNIYEKALECHRKIYAYGMLKFHLDMGDSDNIKLFKRCESLTSEFTEVTSFIDPEITQIPTDLLIKYIDENNNLKRYERELKEIIKNKDHILSEKEESILATFSEVFNSSENTFDILTNTEFHFGKILKEDGSKEEMTDSNYTVFMKDKNENIRKQAFNLMYSKYKEFINTIAELYITKVKEDTIVSRLRKYNSSLEKAVEDDDATIKVFNSLLDAIHQKIDVNHKFIKLKGKLLKKEDLHIYDVYVNPIEVEDDNISFEEAKNEVINALEVMGDNYLNTIKEGFENRWIDVYPKNNKRGGAYMMSVYGVHPYVLDNFVGNKRDISTIIHELGHAMHTYYSNGAQNVIDCDYTTLVAEIASTTNEILLAKYQIENEKNKLKKAEIIYELLEMIRATLFRQSMFVEFEKQVHDTISSGKILSSEDLSNMYYELNKTYFGKDCYIDNEIRYEWARIPHFYSPFYVYTYATGISAAIIIATNIWKKKEGYVDKYIEMLKQGCTKKAVELLKMVDVDLEDVNTYKGAIDFYNEMIDELEKLL